MIKNRINKKYLNFQIRHYSFFNCVWTLTNSLLLFFFYRKTTFSSTHRIEELTKIDSLSIFLSLSRKFPFFSFRFFHHPHHIWFYVDFPTSIFDVTFCVCWRHDKKSPIVAFTREFSVLMTSDVRREDIFLRIFCTIFIYCCKYVVPTFLLFCLLPLPSENGNHYGYIAKYTHKEDRGYYPTARR